jgi:DNA-binding MarR family transcriptional regulator
MTTMSPPTETKRPSQARSGRDAVIDHLLARIRESAAPPGEPLFDAIATTLADALLAHDHATLATAGEQMRSAQRALSEQAEDDVAWAQALGRLQMLMAVAVVGAERLPSADVVARVAPNSRARRVLGALSNGRTMPTDAVGERTGLSTSAISHTAKPLLADGLLVREKVGKAAYWTITPHGKAALEAGGRDGAGPRRRARLVVRPAAAGRILDTTTWEPLQLDAQALEDASEHAGSAVDRSRLLCLDWVVNRTAELTTRLLSWDSLGQFANGDSIDYAVAPLGLGKTAHVWRRSLLNALQHADGASIDLASFWPASPPAFDAYGLVQGKDGSGGVVLVEAKTTAHEFRLGKPRVKDDDDRRRIAAAVRATGQRLGAKRQWRVWPEFPDPVGRLALLTFLREQGIPAWLFNVYFVPPDIERSHVDAPGVSDWWRVIDAVRDDLAISSEHPFSEYVTHEFLPLK